MKLFRIKATAKQSLLLNTEVGADSNVISSTTYVPGSSVRGAFAGEWLKHDPNDQSQAFQKAFIDERVVFSALYPVSSNLEQRSISSTIGWQFGPAFQTAMTCKRFPGFAKTEEKHQVVDYLFQGPSNDPSYKMAFQSCQYIFPDISIGRCDVGLESLSDYFQYNPNDLNTAEKVSPKTSLSTKTAINPMVQSSQAAQLYTIETINEGTCFLGTIKLHEDIDIRQILETNYIRVGTGNTRGLGKLEIEICEMPNTDPIPNITKRLRTLNANARKAGVPCEEKTFWVSLDFTSPIILTDEWMRDQVSIRSKDLEPYGSGLTWKPESQMTRTRRIGGWNALLRMPKQERIGLDAGGVVLVAVQGEESDIINALEKIERYGLGERLGEGFGQVIPCHPFHNDFFPSMDSETIT